MSEDGDNKSLMALIGGILGGKRFDSFNVVAPPSIEAANAVEAPVPAEPAMSVAATADSVEAPPASAVQAEPPPPEPNLSVREKSEIKVSEGPDAAESQARSDGKFALPAQKIAELVMGELQKLQEFPNQGVTVTIYGYHHWNALLAFGPSTTKIGDANRFRQALPDIVVKVRQNVVLAD